MPKKLERWKAKEERKKSHGGEEELKVVLPTWKEISTDWKGKGKKKLEGKERERFKNWMLNIEWEKNNKSGYRWIKTEVDGKEHGS